MSDGKKVGRPSGYTETVQQMADDYVVNHEELQGDLVPSHAGLCCYLGISRECGYEWGRNFVSFSDTLKAISVKQENKLINGALGNAYNSTIAKLMLANHGYSEKQDVNHTSSDGSMTPKGMDGFYAQVDDDE